MHISIIYLSSFSNIYLQKMLLCPVSQQVAWSKCLPAQRPKALIKDLNFATLHQCIPNISTMVTFPHVNELYFQWYNEQHSINLILCFVFVRWDAALFAMGFAVLVVSLCVSAFFLKICLEGKDPQGLSYLVSWTIFGDYHTR